MPIEVTVVDRIATVLINRPEAMNSIDPETRGQMYKAWARIRKTKDVFVAIITSAGDKAFCTGADLKKPTLHPRASRRLC